MTKKGSADGGLACTNSAGNSNKTLSFVNSIDEMVEGLLVVGAQKKVPWIWCQIEGVLFKTEIVCVHLT